jgi:general secretion pathway protein K
LIRGKPDGQNAPEKGFALLIVLWSLAVLSVLVIHVGVIGRGEAKIAGNLRVGTQREALVDGAVFEAAFRVLDHSGGRWGADGTLRTLKLDGVLIAIRIQDLSNAVNLNTATPALLRTLLLAIGADERHAAQLAGAIAVWRGEERSVAARSAVREEYAAAGLEYAPSEAPFKDVEELGMIIGMTPDILARLKPHVTVWSSYGPSRTSADPVVRQAVAQVMREGADLPDDQSYDGSVTIAVTATAMSAAGDGFTRYAVLRFDLNDREHPCRILAWDSRA